MSGCRSRQDLTFQYPCSFRFPPLREGNRPLRFPLLAGGTLRRGLATTACCELWFGDWQVPVHRDLNIAPTPTLPADGEGAAAPPLFTGEFRADKGTSLGFTVCRARPPSALTPSPSPTGWERGAARGHVWRAEASVSAWAEASLPHSIIPLARLRERGTQGVRANKRTRQTQNRGAQCVRPCTMNSTPACGESG